MSNQPDGGQLLSLIERIERLTAERSALAEDIAEVYGEAKGHGYDKKIIRLLVKERAADPADRSEQDALLDLYRDALSRVHVREA
jgi:uncharacterized protein (UPF0335 family)